MEITLNENSIGVYSVLYITVLYYSADRVVFFKNPRQPVERGFRWKGLNFGIKMTWKQLTERDPREWKLSAIDPHDRDTWRSGVRSAMHSASQLPGRGPTDVDMAPVPAR